jgi:hypothetical protein
MERDVGKHRLHHSGALAGIDDVVGERREPPLLVHEFERGRYRFVCIDVREHASELQ